MAIGSRSVVAPHRPSAVVAAGPSPDARTPAPSPGGRSWAWKLGAVLLVAGSAWSAPLGDVGDLTITGDRALGLAAAGVVALLAVRRRLSWTTVHTVLAAFVAIQILTAVINARAWPEGPKFATIYILGFACFALAAECARRPGGARWTAQVWIAVAVVLSVVATISADLSNWYQAVFWGSGSAQPVFTAAERSLFAAKVTFNEWNLFSSFLLIPFSLALWPWHGEAARRGRAVAVLTALVFGLVAGVTRAAWLSMVGIVALWWRLRRPRPWQIAALGAMLLAALLLQALTLRVLPPWAGLQARLFGQPTNIEHRLIINRVTVDSWLDRPTPGPRGPALSSRNVWLGHGVGSVNRLSIVFPGGGRLPRVWTGNAVLFVLHDSGLLGLAALLAVLGVVGRRAASIIARGTGGPTSALTMPLAASGIALCFAYQFTHGLWLMYPYVYLGLLTAVLEPGAD